MQANNYEPAKDFWDTKKNLKFNEPLELNDPRYVDLNSGRGDNIFGRLLKQLGFDDNYNPRSIDKNEFHYALFCGHRGCGKSTELRVLAEKLHKPDGYYIILCDIAKELDINNADYIDILFLAAQKISESLSQNNIPVNEKYLNDLNVFLNEKIITQVNSSTIEASIKASTKAKVGLGLIASLFAEFTAAFKSNSTYKEEVRTLVKNNFSQFKTIFNRMLNEININIGKHEKGKALFFFIDGTDKLDQETCNHIFISHASQLIQLEANFLYTVPIHLIYQSRETRNFYDVQYPLPMVIINDKAPVGYAVLQDMIYKRISPDLFDSDTTVDYVIKMSGGHPRELLHILQETFNNSDSEIFDKQAVDKAIITLKAEYMRFLNHEHYQRLARLAKEQDKESDDIMNILLFNSAVLEYNEYWREPNPIVADTDDFKKALENYDKPEQP